MNLSDAMKLGHQGWVKSPTVYSEWLKLEGPYLFRLADDSDKESPLIAFCTLQKQHLELDDWEPKPWPPELFEAELWVSWDGRIKTIDFVPGPISKNFWRKVKVREIEE